MENRSAPNDSLKILQLVYVYRMESVFISVIKIVVSSSSIRQRLMLL